jgi:hypothetical protein
VTILDESAVISIQIVSREATRIDDKSLNVGSLAREELSSADSSIDNYRGVVKRAVALTSVVQRRYS